MMHRTPIDRTQVVPFENANDLQFRLARSFDLINNWNAALAGHFHFDDVVAILTRQAEALNLSLFRYEDGCAHNISTRARAYDDYKPRKSTGSLLDFLTTHETSDLEPGSIWRLSYIRTLPGFDQSIAAAEWNSRPHIVEVTLIILAHKEDRIDAIEISFDRRMRENTDFPPTLVTTAMANAWAIRAPGLVSRAIRNNRRSNSNTTEGGYFLSQENPAALSRAEQRVCHLLADGDNAKTISERLGLSISTVRSHLRSIYAKTETKGQVNLISVIRQQREAAGL